MDKKDGIVCYAVLLALGIFALIDNPDSKHSTNKVAPTTIEVADYNPPQQSTPLYVTEPSSSSSKIPYIELQSSSNSSRSFTSDDAYNEGYENGYQQGEDDARHGKRHGYNYDDSNDYYNHYETMYYKGYEDGYNDGYNDGYSDSERKYHDDEE